MKNEDLIPKIPEFFCYNEEKGVRCFRLGWVAGFDIASSKNRGTRSSKIYIDNESEVRSLGQKDTERFLCELSKASDGWISANDRPNHEGKILIKMCNCSKRIGYYEINRGFMVEYTDGVVHTSKVEILGWMELPG